MSPLLVIALLTLSSSIPFFESDTDDTDGLDDAELPDDPVDTSDPMMPIDPITPIDPLDPAEPADMADPDMPMEPIAPSQVPTAGNDQLIAAEGETVDGLAGDDTLSTTAENTQLLGGEGRDDITLNATSGLAQGGLGADVLRLAGSTDPEAPSTFSADGGDGDDTIIATSAGGTILGGGGEDRITLTGRFDNVSGGAGEDSIVAASSAAGGGGPIDAGLGNDTVILSEDAGFNTQSQVFGGEGTDRISTQMIVDDGGVDVFDILSGGNGEDVFELSFAPTVDVAEGLALGTVVQIADFVAPEDQLVVDLSNFAAFADQPDAETSTTFDIVDRADASGSDITFTIENPNATGPLTGTIALEGVTGLAADDVFLVFSGSQTAA